jgi:DNA polymerase-1
MEHTLDYRGLQKADSVYIIGIYERLEEGRIHTHYKPEGTGTGRLASENPNLQNVPKELRVIYIPDEGKVFVEGDYSQLELRVLAVIAKEQTMLQELKEGKNTHHIMGYEVFHKQWDGLTEQQKLRAKAIVFGTAYGRSARSVAIEFSIPTMVAEEWQAICINRYPGLLIYKQRTMQEFQATGQITTPFGRTRTVQNLPQALNKPQSIGSDVCLTSLIELDRAGFDLRLTVHDSIAVQFDEKAATEGAREMKRIMERPIEEMDNYQFPVKIGIGNDWYNLTEVKL